MEEVCRIGTRSSLLARAQAEEFRDALGAQFPELKMELVDISTDADTSHSEVPLRQLAGEGVFTKALEEATLDGRVSVSVHSLKDMPTALPAGLSLCCVLPREDPSDLLLLPADSPLLAELPPCGSDLDPGLLPRGFTLGTSSVRRSAALLRANPWLRCRGVRGNLQTRLRKLREGHEGLQGLVLAAAGLRRLGLLPGEGELCWWRLFGGAHAVGQAAIAVLCRAEDAHWEERARAASDAACWAQVVEERALMRGLHGGCSVPITVQHREGELHAAVYSPDGTQVLQDAVPLVEGQEEGSAGTALALRLLEAGAEPLLLLARKEYHERDE